MCVDTERGDFLPWAAPGVGQRKNLRRGLADHDDVAGCRASLPPVGRDRRGAWPVAVAQHSPEQRTRSELGTPHGLRDGFNLP